MAFRFTWGLLPPEYEIYLQRTFLPNPFHVTLTMSIKNNQSTTKYFRVKFTDPNLTTNPYTYDFGAIGSGSTVTKDITLEYNLPTSDTDFTTVIRVEQYADSNYTTLEDASEKTLTIHVYDILNRDDFIKIYKFFGRKNFSYSGVLSTGAVYLDSGTYASYPVAVAVGNPSTLIGSAWSASGRFYIRKLEGIFTNMYINTTHAIRAGGYPRYYVLIARFEDPYIGNIDLLTYSGTTSNVSIGFRQFYLSKLTQTDSSIYLYASANGSSSSGLTYIEDVLVFLQKSAITSKFRQRRVDFYTNSKLNDNYYTLLLGAYNSELGLIYAPDEQGKYWIIDPYEDSWWVNPATAPSSDVYYDAVAPFKDALGNRGWIIVYGTSAYFYNWDKNSWSTFSLSTSAPLFYYLFWRGEQDIVYGVEYNTGKIYKITVSGGRVDLLSSPPVTINPAWGVYHPQKDALYVIGPQTQGIYKYSFSTETWTQIKASHGLNILSYQIYPGGYIGNKVVFFGNNALGIINTDNDSYTETTETYPDIGTDPTNTPYTFQFITVLGSTPDFIYTSLEYRGSVDTSVSPAQSYRTTRAYIYYIP